MNDPDDGGYRSLIGKYLEGSRPPEVPQSDWVSSLGSSPTFYIVAAIAALIGVPFLLIGLSQASFGFFLIGSVFIGLGAAGIAFLEKQRAGSILERVEDRQHKKARELQQDINQPSVMASLSQIEVERYRAQGVFNAAGLEYLRDMDKIELTQAEAARVRQHEAKQARLNRRHDRKIQRSKHRHTLKALQKTINKELQIWESRLKAEHPNEVELAKERLAAWRLVWAEFNTVVDEEDEDYQTYLLRAFETRMKSMYGK